MIAVTGATGALGGRVARLLDTHDVPFVMLARQPDRAPNLKAAVRHCAYGDTISAATALADITTLFMVSASESPRRVEEHRAFIDAAAAAGVEHIVYTSFTRAAPDAVFTLARDHHSAEAYLRSAGPAYTILRNNLYLDFLVTLPGRDRVIRAPAGEGRVAAVSRDDIASVVLHVLTDPGLHQYCSYDLTGPRAFDFDELASALSRDRSVKITYHRETLAEAYDSRRRWTAPQWQYDAWVSTYTAIGADQMSRVSDDVERITGVPPASLEQFLSGGR